MIERNHIYNCDCMEGMREMPDNYVDVAIVDPPFGVGKDGNNQIVIKNDTWKHARQTANLSKKTWDIKADNKFFEELFRISKNQLVFGGNLFSLPISKGWGIWDKEISNKMFSPFEMVWTSFNKSSLLRYMYEGYKRPKGKEREERIHPIQKPVDIYKWLLTNYAKDGDLILDTHMGSGSSYIACLDMGFDYIGYEIDADYFKAIEDRVYHFTRQMALI